MARKVIITLDREETAKSLIGDFANHSHYSNCFEDDVEVVTSDDRLIGRLFSGELTNSSLEKAHAHIDTINTPVTNRFSVAGKGSAMPRILKDGTLSDTSEVPKSVRELVGFSDVIGYCAPTPRCRRGRLSGWTRRHKRARAALTPVLREVDKLCFEE
jgi:hypothetical protein